MMFGGVFFYLTVHHCIDLSALVLVEGKYLTSATQSIARPIGDSLNYSNKKKLNVEILDIAL